MSTIFQKLAELRHLAREGAPVDAGELAAVEAEARTVQTIADLKAEGEAERAVDQAERERLARKADAASSVRAAMTASHNRLHTADQALRDSISVYADAVDAHNTAVTDAVRTLESAGFPTHLESSCLPLPLDDPNYDHSLLPIRATAGDAVKVDGQRIQALDAGHGVIFAASRDTRVWPWIKTWRRSRDTYPIQNPISGTTEAPATY